MIARCDRCKRVEKQEVDFIRCRVDEMDIKIGPVCYDCADILAPRLQKLTLSLMNWRTN